VHDPVAETQGTGCRAVRAICTDDNVDLRAPAVDLDTPIELDMGCLPNNHA
jgi:hypothetical protein